MKTHNKLTLFCLNPSPFIFRCQLSTSVYKENRRLQEVQKKDIALAMVLLHETL